MSVQEGKTVLQEIKRITSGRSVLCALSGGVDSVVLLHLLVRSGISVIAAHMEHGIRGQRSQEDCAFVEKLCADWGVKLVVEHTDVPAQAKLSGCGIEETARRLRYAFLRRQKEALGLDLIATAHHLNDQAETLLMHMLRGASPAGLSGMRTEADGLIRPLLGFSRERIEAYAREHSLVWVQDETNDDTAYTRNYIRHELLPRMSQVNPQAVEALGRLARLSASQNDFIAQQAQKLLAERMHGTALCDVRDVHEGLRGNVLHGYLIRCGIAEPGYEDVQRLQDLLCGASGRRASIGKSFFERDASGIRLVQDEKEGVWPLQLGENDTPLGRFTLTITSVPQKLALGRHVQVLDADKASGELAVRSRRAGDRVQLLGSSGSKLVSDVLCDKKIPRAERGRVPLVMCGEEIIWIAGIAPCKSCAIDGASRRALLINYEKPSEE